MLRYLVYKDPTAFQEAVNAIDAVLGYPKAYANTHTYQEIRQNNKGECLLVLEEEVFRRVKKKIDAPMWAQCWLPKGFEA